MTNKSLGALSGAPYGEPATKRKPLPVNGLRIGANFAGLLPNEKGMALITESIVLDEVFDVKRRSKPVRRRLNRRIGLAQHFEVAGYGRDDYLRYRVWVWKGGEREWLTYRLWAIDEGDFPDLDPEAESVLDSLRELKYEKK